MRPSATRVGAAVAVVVTAVLFAQAAQAATVEVNDGVVIFTAAPGEANDVRGGALATGQMDFTIVDSGAPLTAGAGCQQVDPHSAVCPDENYFVETRPLVMWLGDRSDRATINDYEYRYVMGHGEKGNDTIAVGSSHGGPTALEGGDGNDDLTQFMNGGGHATLTGGKGDDVLRITQLGDGELRGGEGNDQLLYQALPGESEHSLALDGGGGNDSYSFGPWIEPGSMIPGPGLDTLDQSTTSAGGPLDFDMTTCPGCVERVIGSPMADRIVGDQRSQAIFGGAGNDSIDGGGGADVLAGGGDDDTITSRDRASDAVTCDGGADSVVADRFDDVSRDCEIVNRGGPSV